MGISQEAIEKLQAVTGPAPPWARALCDGLSEAFRIEREERFWTIADLRRMIDEFNSLSPLADEQRRLALFRLFHSRRIFHILQDTHELISEYAHRIDTQDAQFNAMHRHHIESEVMVQFCNIRFGPASKDEPEPKHDAHVQAHARQKIPLPYHRIYPIEPKYLVSISKRCEPSDQYVLAIEHLVKTGGFCQCVNLQHREIFRTFPIRSIRQIELVANKRHSWDLRLETASTDN